ncbi:MAG TPA: transglutaminase-like domain-containing protein [Longimicrobiales bacterium]
MRISRRRWLAYGILGIWIAVVAVHVRREYFRPLALVLAEGAARLAPGSTFYLARMGDRAIGMATARIDTLTDGYLAEDFLTLDVPALGAVHRAVAQTRVELTNSLGMKAFDFSLDSEVGRFAVHGEARGDSVLELEIGAGAERQRTTLELGDGLILPTALPLRLAAAGRLEVGEALQIRLFDPSTLAPRDVEIRVTDHETMMVADTAVWDTVAGEWVPVPDTLRAWRLEESFGGISVASWVDEDGRLIRAESPLGFTLERMPYELAIVEWRRSQGDSMPSAGYGAVIEGTAIASDVDLGAVGTFDRLAVRLLDVELDGFDLSGGRQSLRGDTLFITRESMAGHDPGYALPYDGGGAVAAELAATPLVQADDPRIVRLAREIAGGTRDPLVAARLLNDWVYANLEKDVTLSVPSAVQVLESRVGDCNEHTVLYVALARALGLPARTAAGLVHIRGRFYYHAWPEVWLGRWVAVDPTLGQFPADASHLRFLVGGLARQVELVRLIGRLRLETVETAAVLVPPGESTARGVDTEH